MSKQIEMGPVTPPLPEFEFKTKFWFSLIGLIGVLLLGATLVADQLYRPEQFNISKISLTGDAAHVDREALKQSVIAAVDGNYFSLNSKKIIDVVQALPWVEKVRLRRRWPATLMIDIEEYQPVAIWGEERWLTTTGKLVKLPLPKNVVLPHLNAPSHEVHTVWPKYKQWSAKFARQGLRLQSMTLSKQHLYTLQLEYTSPMESALTGFEMVLAESNAEQQIDAFLSSYQQSLIDAPGQIKTVDLRYPSGFSVSRHAPEEIAQAAPN